LGDVVCHSRHQKEAAAAQATAKQKQIKKKWTCAAVRESPGIRGTEKTGQYIMGRARYGGRDEKRKKKKKEKKKPKIVDT
jgi:hypothetical protein